jgi:hypothetical protein
MEPYLALMRRYCIDYTTVHDVSVCDDIMREDYTVTVSGRTLQMPDYRAAVAGAFRWFPTLTLTVHEMVLSGDRPGHALQRARRLVQARRRAGGVAGHLAVRAGRRAAGPLRCRAGLRGARAPVRRRAPRPPGRPPTSIHGRRPRSQPADARAEATAARLAAGLGDRGRTAGRSRRERFDLVIDDSHLVGPDDLVLDDVALDVPDLFSAGSAIAARSSSCAAPTAAVWRGLPGERRPRCELPATVLAHAARIGLVDVRIIRDRWGLQRRLR